MHCPIFNVGSTAGRRMSKITSAYFKMCFCGGVGLPPLHSNTFWKKAQPWKHKSKSLNISSLVDSEYCSCNLACWPPSYLTHCMVNLDLEMPQYMLIMFSLTLLITVRLKASSSRRCFATIFHYIWWAPQKRFHSISFLQVETIIIVSW